MGSDITERLDDSSSFYQIMALYHVFGVCATHVHAS